MTRKDWCKWCIRNVAHTHIHTHVLLFYYDPSLLLTTSSWLNGCWEWRSICIIQLNTNRVIASTKPIDEGVRREEQGCERRGARGKQEGNAHSSIYTTLPRQLSCFLPAFPVIYTSGPNWMLKSTQEAFSSMKLLSWCTIAYLFLFFLNNWGYFPMVLAAFYLLRYSQGIRSYDIPIIHFFLSLCMSHRYTFPLWIQWDFHI